ncbi:hypothetical protein ACLMJK_000622 [Lecanora helva]
MHHYILCLRQQLKNTKVKVIELFPPAVQKLAELHDEKHQPDIKDGRNWGMPLDQFTDEAYEGLAAGKEEVAVEKAKIWYDSFEPQRQKVFYDMIAAMS